MARGREKAWGPDTFKWRPPFPASVDPIADLFGLSGQAAVVTGATRGNGLAIARRLAEVGAHVVVTSRHKKDAETVAKQLSRDFDAPALGLEADGAKREDVRRLFKAVEHWEEGPLRVLVNNAGYPVVPGWWDTPLHEMQEAELEKAMDTVRAADLDGSRWCTFYALPLMLKRRKGSIVFTSSTPAITGYRGTPYTEAKAGILGLMRDVAREYGPKGIRANAIAPGNIRTEWLKQVSPAERRRLEKENPLRRFGEPQEIANVVLFLASDLSSFVTGETIIVDGGTVIR